MSRWARGWKLLPRECSELLGRRQLGLWEAGLPGRAPGLPTGPQLPGMLWRHAWAPDLLLLKLPGRRLRLHGWEGLLHSWPRSPLHVWRDGLQQPLPLLLLRMAPRHVQLPRRLRALLRLHYCTALHLQVQRHLLGRDACWRELRVHPMRRHGDLHHVRGPGG